MSLIAVIDDDEYIGDMLKRALESEGYQVVRAYSGTEALLLFEKSRPDLVLLDLMMPGLAGEEVLKNDSGICQSAMYCDRHPDDAEHVKVGGGFEQCFQRRFGRVEQCRLKKQISACVTRDRQFGENDSFDVFFAGFSHKVGNLCRIICAVGNFYVWYGGRHADISEVHRFQILLAIDVLLYCQ